MPRTVGRSVVDCSKVKDGNLFSWLMSSTSRVVDDQRTVLVLVLSQSSHDYLPVVATGTLLQ